MKTFVVFSSLLVLAMAKPSIIYREPTIFATGPVLSQYHSQDSLGQYSYGYSGGASAKNEVRSFDGITRGSYSYVDPEGKLQAVSYTSDAANGFRVAATNLPEAPVDTGVAPEPVKEPVEVVRARAEHLAIVEQGGVKPIVAERFDAELKPIEETPEVKLARDEHLAAIEKAKLVTGPIVPEVELRPVEDTVEVKVARDEHMAAIEKAKTITGPIVPEVELRPVEDTIEVKLARDEHLAAIEKAKTATGPIVPQVDLRPIEDTIEVKLARDQHMKAIEVAKARVAIPQTIVPGIVSPVTRFAFEQPIVKTVVPSVRFAEAPVVTRIETPIVPRLVASSPYAYNYQVVAPGYTTNAVVNAGVYGSIIEPERLIRSV